MKKKIKGGLYLVIDPGMPLNELLPKLHQAIEGGVDVLQVWNRWRSNQHKKETVDAICALAHTCQLPVIINEEWELLKTTNLDGVHFNVIPANLDHIRQSVDRPFIYGITCANDLSRVHWAKDNGADYISFCSLFPSASAGSCEIVSRQTVQEARRITTLPIFLAGGISFENLCELSDTGMDGVALISAIMKADDPQIAAQAFKNKLKTMHHETITG